MDAQGPDGPGLDANAGPRKIARLVGVGDKQLSRAPKQRGQCIQLLL
jgi:hypothetical protein